MSIDWLLDLERAVDSGRDYFACPGVGRNQWVIARTVDDLKKTAKRAADMKKMAVSIFRLIPKGDAAAGDLFLAPTVIGEPGARGEPQIEWKQFDAREAAETFRDVRHGPAPFFGIQIESTIDPETSAV